MFVFLLFAAIYLKGHYAILEKDFMLRNIYVTHNRINQLFSEENNEGLFKFVKAQIKKIKSKQLLKKFVIFWYNVIPQNFTVHL